MTTTEIQAATRREREQTRAGVSQDEYDVYRESVRRPWQNIRWATDNELDQIKRERHAARVE